jgi:MFS transporter, putative metabolite:H+ symporter
MLGRITVNILEAGMTITIVTLADDFSDAATLDAASRPLAVRMDRLPVTRLHIAFLTVGTLGFFFDLIEVTLGSVLSAVFSTTPHNVGTAQLSLLLSAMYIGATAGAPLAGWMADLYGRRTVLMWVLLILSVSSAAAAASPDIAFLIAARVVSGFALGAYPPLLISLFTDVLPPRYRGRIIMIVAGLATLGPVAMLFLVRWLTPIEPLGIEAWRWAFIVGTAGSLSFGIAFGFLPESPRWLSARGREAEAKAVLTAFEQSARVFGKSSDPALGNHVHTDNQHSPKFDRRQFAFFAGLNFLAPWSAIAFPLMMGAVLIEKGFALSDSLFYSGIVMFGPVFGTILAAFVIDRVQRRTALAIVAVLMILSGTAFAVALTPIWLMAAGLAFSITGQLYVPTLIIYTAESFPTTFRARAGAGTWAVNRVASAMSPLILLPLLKSVGVEAMFAVMISAVALGLIVVLIFGAPSRAGLAVD